MDAKLQEVMLDYGLEGYGLYWYCIELIAQNVNSNNLTFELEHDARIIARNTGSTPQKVEQMITSFINLGLLNESNSHVFCLKLASRCDDFTAKAVRRNGVKPVTNQSVGVSPTNSDKVHLEVRSKKKEEEIDAPKVANIDWDDLKNHFNSLMPNKTVASITDKRKKHIRAMLKSTSRDIETLKASIEYAATSENGYWPSHRNGNTDHTGKFWPPKDFDFYMRESTFLKSIED
jgi:hypothetical protein